ncbi:hypothetical protein Yalta_158 [Yalta virus]|nr:hypothetical protein Yalta_158 [Yalta virus]
MSDLNADQQKIKDYVQNCFDKKKICHLLIQGVAGTGKSFLINKIVEMSNSYDMKCIIGSHQAIAAALVNGLTLCKIFGVFGSRDKANLSIGGYNYFLERNEQKNTYDKKTIKRSMYLREDKNFNIIPQKNILIIDEISMVGLEFLDDMDHMLQSAFDNKKPFGGINLIFCGHFSQLRPVKETPIFTLTVDHFVKHMKLFELTINQRQQDQEFFDLCNGVMRSCLKSDQKKLLKSRLVSNFDPSIFKDLVHIFPTKKLCYEHNMKRLLDLNEEDYYFLKANDNGEYKSISKDEKKCFNGLNEFIIFARNAKIMITVNHESFLNGEIYKIGHINLKKTISLDEFLHGLDDEDKRSIISISNILSTQRKKIYYCKPQHIEIFVDRSTKFLYSDSKQNETEDDDDACISLVSDNKETSSSSLEDTQLTKNDNKDITENGSLCLNEDSCSSLIDQMESVNLQDKECLTKISPCDKAINIVVVKKNRNGYEESENRKIFNRCIQPFQLAWAVTTHKIQGISLDEGIIDLGEANFDPVQLYVNISRLRSLDNMYIRDLQLPLPVSPYKKIIKKFIEEIKTNNQNNTAFVNTNSSDESDVEDFDFDEALN